MSLNILNRSLTYAFDKKRDQLKIELKHDSGSFGFYFVLYIGRSFVGSFINLFSDVAPKQYPSVR